MLDGRIRQRESLLRRFPLEWGMGAALQPGRGYGPEIGQQSDGSGFVFFVGRKQHTGGIAVPAGGSFGKGKSLIHLCAACLVLRRGQHRADVPIEQFAVQSRVFFLHPLRRAVAGTLCRGDRSHRKADAAAPDGGQNAGQRICCQEEKHPFRRFLHDLQQGVGRLFVHPLHVIKQDGAALGRKAGVEDLAPHGLDLTDQIPAIGTHARHRDGFPDDAGLHPAAVAVTGLAHGTAALAPEQSFGRCASGRIQVVRRHAPGGKPGTEPLFAHQQHTVGQAAALQHQAHTGFQLRVALETVDHHRKFPLISGFCASTAPGAPKRGRSGRPAGQRTQGS